MKKKRKDSDQNDTDTEMECLSLEAVEMDSHELLRQSMTDPITKMLKKSSRKNKKNAEIHACNWCEKKFCSIRKLNKHLLTHGPKPFACDRCPSTFKCRKYLTRHISTNHVKKKQFQCEVCEKVFLFPNNLKAHMRIHTGEKPYKCKFCDKCFTARYSLQAHTYLHTDEKPYKCAFCEYACRDNSTLRKHQHRHMGLPVEPQCPVCQKKLKSKQSLNEHMLCHHGTGEKREERRFTCDHCGRSFSVKNNLAKHIRVIHDKISSAVECHICGRQSSNPGNLRAHLRTHTDLRPYRCAADGCGKRYKDKSSLSKHTILHSEVRFSCEECGRQFSRRERLKRHRVKVHRRTRGAQCGLCGDRFYSNSYLSRHMHRKHSSAARLECDECGLRTNNKPALVRHIAARHTDQGRRCKLCGAVVSHRRYLRAHYWNDHAVRFKTKSRGKRTTLVEEPPPEVAIKEEVVSEPEAELDLLDIDKHEIEDAADALQQGSLLPAEPPKHDTDEGASTEYSPITHIPKDADEHGEDLPARDTSSGGVIEPSENVPETKDFREFPAKDIPDGNVNKEASVDVPETEDSREFPAGHIPSASTDVPDDPSKDSSIKDNPDGDVSKEASLDVVPRTEVNGGEEQEVDSPREVLERLFTQHVHAENGRKVKLNGCIDIHAEELCKEEINKLLGQATGPQLKMTTKLMSTKQALVRIDPETLKNIVVSNRKSTQNNNIPNRKLAQVKKRIKNTVNKTKTVIVPEDRNNVINKKVKTMAVNEKITSEEEDKIVRVSKKNKTKNKVKKKKKRDEKERREKKETRQVQNGAKFLLDVQQCYVCFKLFKTKEDLTKHCQEHFDLCSEKMLKKCPYCEYVTKYNLARHVRLVHKVNIKVKYGKIRDRKNCSEGSRYTMAIDGADVDEIEVIPSINNLNKIAGMKLDEANRNKKDSTIAKQKLVRRGNEWMFEQESIEDGYEMPKFTDNDLKAAGVKDTDNYVQKLRKLYHLNKKNGVAMLFPCDGCVKVCQALSGLILHRRRHDPNKKPFKKKIWKHKLTQPELEELEKRKHKRTAIIDCNDKPKPIVNKHKCDPKLKDFYLNNIRGGDIEFWQFLKIFNKMGRENVNDFQDLEGRHDFGIHPIHNETQSATNDIASTSDRTQASLKSSINNKLKRNVKKNLSLKFKRVIRLTTQEQKQREAVRKEMREKIREQSLLN